MTEEVFTELKCRLRAYRLGLVSSDDIFGYIQGLVDLGCLNPTDIMFILECIRSKDSGDSEWIFK